MLLAVLICLKNYAKIMQVSQNYALCHRNYATKMLGEIKITSSLTVSTLTVMNIHTVHLPVLSITNTHVSTSKSQMINK